MEVMSTYFARLRRCAAAAAAAALSFGCTQTEIDSTIVGPEGGVEHEVVFDFVCEEYTGTATFDPTSDGTVQTRTPSSAGFAFEDGAVIHVLAEFTKKEEFRGEKVGAYECYRYNKQSGTWSALGSSEDNPSAARMLWPLNTQYGKFTAFYVPAQANILGFGESNVVTTELQSLNMIGQRDGSDHVIGDPLQAEIDQVGYDGKVRLVFRHACTRLILSDIRGTSDMAYRIVRGASSDNDLNNGYQLQIERTAVANGANEYTYTGKFIWGKVEDEKLKLNNSDGVEKYYVSAPLSSDAGKPDMSDPKNNWLCFYLEPGNYYGSIVTYRNNDIYLTLNVAGLGGEGDTAPKEEQGLEANKSYMMDIRMVDGVVNNELVETPDEWAPADEEAIPVDVEKFMNALENGAAYEDEKGRQILERTSNGLKLNYNVDFQNVNLYHLFKNSDKDLSTFRRAGSNLDGQNHAIVNVNGALFYNLNATISNLAIRHAKITFPEKVNAAKHQPDETGDDEVTAEELINHYNNSVGLFTTISGSLNNVLIEGITVNIDLEKGCSNDKLKNNLDAATIYPNIGALCGSLTGISGITGVHLRGTADHKGDITVNVKGPDLYRANFSIGGLVGRLSSGPLQNVDLYMGDAEYHAPTISVTTDMGSNKETEASGRQVLSRLEVGGIVGYAEYGCSDISLISCPITVDCKESISNLCHAGGFAGRARGNYTVDDPNSGYIDNVSVGATVTGGKCTITSNNGQDYYGNSYTGGLVGYVQSRQISGCTVSGSVTAGQRVVNSDVDSRISIGGIIGCIGDRVHDQTFLHGYDIKKSRVYDCTAYVTIDVDIKLVGGSTAGEAMRYYAGRCIGMQNSPNTNVYTQPTNSCFVPAPSRRDLKTYNFANEERAFYDQSKKLSELGQSSFILELGDVGGDSEHHGWNPYDSGVGNINYTTSGGKNAQLPFCGAYADEKNSDNDNGDVWTD